jgi:hypothetical protein
MGLEVEGEVAKRMLNESLILKCWTLDITWRVTLSSTVIPRDEDWINLRSWGVACFLWGISLN